MTSLSPSEYDTPIETLDLTVRAYNGLKRVGITVVGEVLEMLERIPDQIPHIPNFGEASLQELVRRLKEQGWLPQDWDFRKG